MAWHYFVFLLPWNSFLLYKFKYATPGMAIFGKKKMTIIHDHHSIKVADLQSYNFKIYKSLPKTYNIIRITIHHLFKRQLFLHKLCKSVLKMAANGKNICIFSNNISSEEYMIMMWNLHTTFTTWYCMGWWEGLTNKWFWKKLWGKNHNFCLQIMYSDTCCTISDVT